MQNGLMTYQHLREARPLKQGMVIFLISAVFVIIFGLFSSDQEVEWFLSLTAIGFYTWINAVLSFFQEQNKLRYFGESILVFIAISALFWLIDTGLSTVSIFDIRELLLLYAVTVVFYGFALLIVALIRNIAKLMGIRID